MPPKVKKSSLAGNVISHGRIKRKYNGGQYEIDIHPLRTSKDDKYIKPSILADGAHPLEGSSLRCVGRHDHTEARRCKNVGRWDERIAVRRRRLPTELIGCSSERERRPARQNQKETEAVVALRVIRERSEKEESVGRDSKEGPRDGDAAKNRRRESNREEGWKRAKDRRRKKEPIRRGRRGGKDEARSEGRERERARQKKRKTQAKSEKNTQGRKRWIMNELFAERGKAPREEVIRKKKNGENATNARSKYYYKQEVAQRMQMSSTFFVARSSRFPAGSFEFILFFYREFEMERILCQRISGNYIIYFSCYHI